MNEQPNTPEVGPAEQHHQAVEAAHESFLTKIGEAYATLHSDLNRAFEVYQALTGHGTAEVGTPPDQETGHGTGQDPTTAV